MLISEALTTILHWWFYPLSYNVQISSKDWKWSVMSKTEANQHQMYVISKRTFKE